MSGAAPPRKGILKRPNATRALRRGIGARGLVNVNGRAIGPVAAAGPRLMFSNVSRVRPFNFTNAAVEAGTANFNVGAELVIGKNARGRAPRIEPHDPRRDPGVYGEEGIFANPAEMHATMVANTASRSKGLEQFNNAYRTMNIFRTTPLETIVRHNPNHPIFLNTPIKNILGRLPQAPLPTPDEIPLTDIRDMAEKYGFHRLFEELKYLENLELEGMTGEEIEETQRKMMEARPEMRNEIQALVRVFQRQAGIAASEAVAHRAAAINAHTAWMLNDSNLGGGRRSSRRNRKTRRNRK